MRARRLRRPDQEALLIPNEERRERRRVEDALERLALAGERAAFDREASRLLGAGVSPAERTKLLDAAWDGFRARPRPQRAQDC
jgi:hypothetical protein